MRSYEPGSACEKCGHNPRTVAYHRAGQVDCARPAYGVEDRCQDEGEHLLVTCSTCGYVYVAQIRRPL